MSELSVGTVTAASGEGLDDPAAVGLGEEEKEHCIGSTLS